MPIMKQKALSKRVNREFIIRLVDVDSHSSRLVGFSTLVSMFGFDYIEHNFNKVFRSKKRTPSFKPRKCSVIVVLSPR